MDSISVELDSDRKTRVRGNSLYAEYRNFQNVSEAGFTALAAVMLPSPHCNFPPILTRPLCHWQIKFKNNLLKNLQKNKTLKKDAEHSPSKLGGSLAVVSDENTSSNFRALKLQ